MCNLILYLWRYFPQLHVLEGHNQVYTIGLKVLFNRLPDDKILALSRLKAFADDYSNIAKMV